MYKRKECVIDTLKAKAEHLVRYGGNPKMMLDTCFYLQFFPAQWKLCQKLTEKAFKELKQNNNGDFKVYYLLYKAGIQFFVKDPKVCDPTIALFAYQKMKETKNKRKHMKIILGCWYELIKIKTIRRLFGQKPR